MESCLKTDKFLNSDQTPTVHAYISHLTTFYSFSRPALTTADARLRCLLCTGPSKRSLFANGPRSEHITSSLIVSRRNRWSLTERHTRDSPCAARPKILPFGEREDNHYLGLKLVAGAGRCVLLPTLGYNVLYRYGMCAFARTSTQGPMV